MSLAIAVTVTALLLAGTTASAVPAPEASVAAAKPGGKKHLSKAQRARIRRALRQQLRRNPASALKRSFMRKASFVDFKLPLTIRLSRAPNASGPEPSDDVLEITWDDSVIPWPLAGDGGFPPPPQLTNLSGQFTMESSFSDSEGYGELGAMETVIGGGISMTSTPFRISDFAAPCPSNAQLEADPNALVAITSAGPKYGLMNMFSGEVRGSLALRMTFAGQRYAGCGVAPAPTDTVDNSAAIPMPVRFEGTMRVSPSVTADGKMRIGLLTVDDAATPQTSSFAYVRGCTGSAPCTPMQFPARLKLKKLTAEVILGDTAA